MQRHYRVRGAHVDSGFEVDEILVASDEAHARSRCREMRIAIQSIEDMDAAGSANTGSVAEGVRRVGGMLKDEVTEFRAAERDRRQREKVEFQRQRRIIGTVRLDFWSTVWAVAWGIILAAVIPIVIGAALAAVGGAAALIPLLVSGQNAAPSPTSARAGGPTLPSVIRVRPGESLATGVVIKSATCRANSMGAMAWTVVIDNQTATQLRGRITAICEDARGNVVYQTDAERYTIVTGQQAPNFLSVGGSPDLSGAVKVQAILWDPS